MQHPAVIPTHRDEDWWQARHQQLLIQRQAMQNNVELVFLGDSITHAWELEGEAAWQQYFSSAKTLNLGFAGDRTEHLLWRIKNGEIDDISPTWLVLLIGTNNAGHRHDSAEEIEAGVTRVLEELKQRLPNTKIILMAIFPRSRNRSKRMRSKVDNANILLKSYADNNDILWLDINHKFLTDEGVLLESVMPDLLHPNALQYYVWAETIQLIITQTGATQSGRLNEGL